MHNYALPRWMSVTGQPLDLELASGFQGLYLAIIIGLLSLSDI